MVAVLLYTWVNSKKVWGCAAEFLSFYWVRGESNFEVNVKTQFTLN